MSSSDKVKHSLIPYYDPNFEEPALTDEEAALMLLQIRTGIIPLPPRHQSGYRSGSWSQKPVYDALVIRRIRIDTVREHESGSRSWKPMHDGNTSGTAHDFDFKGPALTDERAALILPQIRTSIYLLPASSHAQCEYGSQTRKPMHDDSGDRISDTTSHSNREPTNITPQSNKYGSSTTISATPSNTRYSVLGEKNPAKFNGSDLDSKISDTASGMGSIEAGAMNYPERVDHHLDPTISDPEFNKYRFSGETSSNTVENDSGGTNSDPGLGNKYQFVWDANSKISGNDSDGTISDRELEGNYYQNVTKTIVINNDSNATISDPELDNKDYYVYHRHSRSLMDATEKPTVSIPPLPLYDGYNKRGHIRSYCPTRLRKIYTSSKNDCGKQRMLWRKRKAPAECADQDSIMTHDPKKRRDNEK